MRVSLRCSTAPVVVRMVDSPRPTAWLDHPVTTETPIRAAHVNQLRRVIDGHRSRLGLSVVTWTDDPIVRFVTPIRALHFLEIRNATQAIWDAAHLGLLPYWAGGSPPSRGRLILAADVNDIRSWVDRYERHVPLARPMTSARPSPSAPSWLIQESLCEPNVRLPVVMSGSREARAR